MTGKLREMGPVLGPLKLSSQRPTASSARICHPTTSCVCVCVCERRSVVPDSLQPHGLWPASLLCPWNSPGKNTGVGCHSLLQTIFPAQGLNPVFCIAGRFFLSSKPLGKARLISTCKIPDTLIEGMREILKNLRNQPRIHGLGKGKE